MNKFNSITDKVRNQYIEEYLECAKVVNYTDIVGSYGAKTVLYRDLPNTHMDGYPFASDYVCGADGWGHVRVRGGSS